MNALTTFVSHCRIKAALCCGAVLLLTACGGNVENTHGQQSLATVETSQASPATQPTPDTAVVAPTVDGATGDGGPSTAEELFKANSEQAYGPVQAPDAAPDPAMTTSTDVRGTPTR
jgi:hypothetical protein